MHNPGTIRHYAVHTRHQQECLARDEITAAGFTVLFPQYLREVRHARKTELLPRALFPSYIFAAFDRDVPSWRPIRRMRGVDSILSVGDGTPIPVPAAAIADLEARMASEDGYVAVGRAATLGRPGFKDGQPLRMKQGSFTGYGGFYGGTDRDRVVFLMSLFGREMTLVVPFEAVEAA